jgi:hypothetical protein
MMKDIIEAIRVGENPDLIDPGKRSKIEQGELGYEPLMPKGSETTQEVASVAYQRAMDKLRRYVPANRIPRHPGQFPGLLMGMMQTLQRIKQIENIHCEYLEMLAVDTVLALPEFEAAKQAVDRGDLRIEVKLDRLMVRPPEEEDEVGQEEIQEVEQSFEAELAQMLVNMDQEKMKRRFQNIMAQGAAANYMYLYELSRNILAGINPNLSDMYGYMQSVGDMAMWALPEMQGEAAGEEEVTQDEETGAGVIKAHAIIYPLLIHEIVKGLIEYVNSFGLSTIPATRSEVQAAVDRPEHEVYDLMLGPIFWKRLSDAIDPKNVNLLLHVWSKITTLPAFDDDIKGSFAAFIKEFLKDPESAKRIIHSFTVDVQKAIDKYEDEQDKGDTPTFESYSYDFIMEALTNRLTSILNHYNASIPDEPAADPEYPGRIMSDSPQQPKKISEQEFEQWAAVDPSGEKYINLPVIMELKKQRMIKTPKDILNIINKTTYIPLKKNERWIPTNNPQDPGGRRREVTYTQQTPEEAARLKKENAPKTLPWVLKQIKDHNIIYPEDLNDVKDVLNFFFKYRDGKNWPAEYSKDLTAYPKMSDLSHAVLDIKYKLFASSMNKKIKTIYPDTILIDVYQKNIEDESKEDGVNDSLYELIRILPTPEGQKSLYTYVNETGTRMAGWCIAFAPSQGWSYFCNYLKLNDIHGYDNIKQNPGKRLPQEIIDNPLYSAYYVAKDGMPYAAFEFQANDYQIANNSEGRHLPEYNSIIKPMIMKAIPVARNIVEPHKIERLPSIMLKEYIAKRPKEFAMFIVCKLKNIATHNSNPFAAVIDQETAKNAAIDLLQNLNLSLREAFIQKDSSWRNGLNRWAKYSSGGAKIAQTPKNIESEKLKINIDTSEVRTLLTQYLLEHDSIRCDGMGNMSLKFKDALEQRLIKIEEEREFELEESVKKNRERLGEGRFSKSLGTAILAGTLGLSSSGEAGSVRGIENNNPGNIVVSKTKWRGAIGNDGRFLKFDKMENGIRAMTRILKVYRDKYGINSIEGVIKRWAPHSDKNPTNEYIEFVSKHANISRNQKIKFTPSEIYRIVNAIIKFENGRSVPEIDIIRGVRAGIT